jgi:hypothetical protein
MDSLDQHDLEQLLQEHGVNPHRNKATLLAKLERFFCVELPERERVRAAARDGKGDVARSFPATVRVLSPNNPCSDELILDNINAALHAHPIRVSTLTDDQLIARIMSPQACGELAKEIAQTLREHHFIPWRHLPQRRRALSNPDFGLFDEAAAVKYLTNFLGEVFAGRPPAPIDIHLASHRSRGLKLGDQVTWSSQSGGVRKDKLGTVIEVIPPGAVPSGKGFGGPRDHTSVLVEVTEGRTGKKRRYWPLVRLLHVVGLLALLALAAACGALPGGGTGDDEPPADGGAELDDGGGTIADGDPNPDAAPPDAGPGLPFGSACDPLAAECAGGLTCRVKSLEPVEGRCLAVGSALENDPCDLDNGDADCGAAMVCIGSSDTRCYVICDPADPVPRCGVADTCVQVWGANVELGACAP